MVIAENLLLDFYAIFDIFVTFSKKSRNWKIDAVQISFP